MGFPNQFIIFAIFLLLISCKPKDMALNRDNFDTSVNPGTDFYQYANGGWIKNNPMPPEFSRYGSFDVLAENTVIKLKELIENIKAGENPEGSIAQKVQLFYTSGMDTARIEENGIKPIQAELDLINSANNIQELQRIIARWHLNGFGLLFGFFGAPDRVNSEMVIANIYQGGIGLTDVDYYLSDDENSKNILEEYHKYISKMHILASYSKSEAEIRAEKIIRMETRLAGASMSRLERRDPHKTFNKITVNELKKLVPNFNWNDFFLITGYPAFDEINVGQPLFFSEINSMMKDIPLEDWKIYLIWHIINNSSEYLSSDFVNTNFEFYGKFLSGKQELQARWKRIIKSVDIALGEALGKLYVEKYFPPEAKERMMKLVNNLKYAMAERIRALEWMSEATKKEALEKLEKINAKIAYPDIWRDYSDLKVSGDSYFQNILRAATFNFNYNINKIGKPVDPNEWGMTPQTVNAYYHPARNEIVFPAAILQPPFFYMDADDAVNYGAIGMVIGHEMTHGFDDKGRMYDKNGNLRDWWTNEDAERFTERSKVLVKQYNEFIVHEDIKANGELTLGENIADLGGLNIAFTALKKAWKESPPEHKINGLSPEQRFFLAYAHIWAQNITIPEMIRRTKEDVHSLGKYRVNGPLPHMPEFHKAFDISKGESMYLNPEERAFIW